LALALFLLVLGGRLLLITQHGSPLPQLDEWGAVGTQLLKPASDGSLQPADLWAPHNEHRILTTRLLVLGLGFVQGGWPTWTLLAANAVLNALLAALIMALLAPHLERGARLLLAVLIVLAMGGPSGWQNALWGFQASFYLCALCSVLALALLTPALHASQGPGALKPRHSGLLAAGLGYLVLALLSLGSGSLALASLCALAVLSLWTSGKGALRRHLPVLATLLLGGVAAFLLAPRNVHAAGLAPGSLGQAATVLTHCLAWPLMEIPAAALLLQAPAVLVLATLVWRRTPPSRLQALALSLWFLSLLGMLGVTLTRAGGLVDGIPLSRYQDTFIPGLLANLVLAWTIAGQEAPWRILRAAWLGAALLGLALCWHKALVRSLPLQDLLKETRIEQVEAWESGGDRDALTRAIPPLRPAPDPAHVTGVLADPVLRPLLPRDFREPAPWPRWLGPVLAAFGVAMLAYSLLRTDRKKARPERTG